MSRKTEKEVRSIWIHLRVTKREYDKINAFYKQTTSRKLSEYIRDVLLREPVTVKHRNASADEFLSVALQLKKELSAIGNNYNQAVHKLHITVFERGALQWLKEYEQLSKSVLEKVNEISAEMDKIYQQWLLK